MKKWLLGANQISPGQPENPLPSPHLPTPSASTCMPSYPGLLKQPIIVVLIRVLSAVGRKRVAMESGEVMTLVWKGRGGWVEGGGGP